MCCLLFVGCCLLFGVCDLFIFVRCLFCWLLWDAAVGVVCCVLPFRASLFVVVYVCSLVIVGCLACVACCSLLIVCCLLSVNVCDFFAFECWVLIVSDYCPSRCGCYVVCFNC